MDKNFLKLCLITHRQTTQISSYKEFILQAIEGGVTSVQLREKSSNLDQIIDVSLEIKKILDRHNIPLIINDYVEIAKEIDADGVHLGQSDLSPESARKLLGPKKIIGWSIDSFSDLKKANQMSCIDYVAASSVFKSETKFNCKTIWGLDGLKKITQQSKHPVVAIGGIHQNNVRHVIRSGAKGVAVISAIHYNNRPKQSAEALILGIDQALGAVHV